MKPGGESNINNWRLFRSMSGGLTAELCSHQVDISDWMLGSSPEFVMGLGSLDTLKDGRNVYDNLQLIYKYPAGQKMTYSAISTNQFVPYFNGSRAEMGEIIMGTEGTVEITVGDDSHPAIAWWYREPPKTTTRAAGKQRRPFRGRRDHGSREQRRHGPHSADDQRHGYHRQRRLLQPRSEVRQAVAHQKGVFMQEEPVNPVDTELRSFLQNCRDGQRPRADVEVGLNDAVAVILSNQAMDEGRKVYFNEIEKMGRGEAGHKTL